MSPDMVKAISELLHQNGVAAMLLVFYVLKDWAFTSKIVANNARSIEILESIQREGVKCRHE